MGGSVVGKRCNEGVGEVIGVVASAGVRCPEGERVGAGAGVGVYTGRLYRSFNALCYE